MPPAKDPVHDQFKDSTCIHCKTFRFRRAVPRDLRNHLATCSAAPLNVKLHYINIKQTASKRPLISDSPNTASSSLTTPTTVDTPTTVKRQRTLLEYGTVPAESSVVDTALTRMLTGCGLPYSLVDHPLFTDFVRAATGKYCVTAHYCIVFKCNSLTGNAYKSPCRQTVTEKYIPALFESERNEQAKEMVSVCGTLLIDGRTDLNRGLASSSFVSKTSEQVISSFDFEVDGQSASVYVRDLEYSLEFVKSNRGIVIGLCTDNCSTMRSTRSEFSLRYPDILCYACTDHLLDLLMSYFAEATICQVVIGKVKAIQNVFRKHSRILAALKTVANYVLPQVPPDTRWHYASDMIQNYLKNRTALITCSHLEEVEELISPFRGQMNLLYDSDFTASVRRVETLLEPFKKAIKTAESDKCPAESIVDLWLTLKDTLSKLPGDVWRSMQSKEIFTSKFEDFLMGISDGHLAAYFLHPAYDNKRLSSKLKTQAIDYCANFIDRDFLVSWFVKVFKYPSTL